QQRDLRPLALLECPQLLLELGLFGGRQRASEVGDARFELGNRDDVSGRHRRGKSHRETQREAAKGVPACAHGSGALQRAGAALKSTDGGFEIAASFSTVKLGFTWCENIF